MTPERALEICGAVSDCTFAAHGLAGPAPDWLADVTLTEMLEAADVVSKLGGKKLPDGGTEFNVIPSNGTIAAAYLLMHREPSNEIIAYDGKGKALAVARFRRYLAEDGDAA